MSQDYIICPFTVIADSREQSPWHFTGFKADAAQNYKPLIVPVEVAGLKSGDYSLKGFEDRVGIERKSLADAYSTFSQGRDRFERELERLQEMEFAAVVIEASWPAVLFSPPPHTKFSPKSFFRSVIAWQIRYPQVHWWACETRTFAERVTFRLLQRFWLDEQERLKHGNASA